MKIHTCLPFLHNKTRHTAIVRPINIDSVCVPVPVAAQALKLDHLTLKQQL